MYPHLRSLRTRDGVVLHGMLFLPKRTRSTAVIWIHGLGSSFYQSLPRSTALAAALTRRGMGLAVFNTRGHDTVVRLDRTGRSKKYAGAAFERFSDCVHDIRAVVDLLRREGFRRIVLVGHSTGANKAVYYLAKTRDRRIAGLGLLGPLSDTISEQHARGRAYARILRTAARQIAAGRGDALLMPEKLGALWSALRYHSLFRAGSGEDVFPYGNPQGSWRSLASVRIPILAMIGEHDEHRDRPVTEIIGAIHDHTPHAPRFRGIVIRNATHSFRRHENAMATEIQEWIVEDCS